MTDFSRRHFMMGAGVLTCCGITGFSSLSMAKTGITGDKRLLVVILRGAMDGLAAIPAIGDKDYRDARRTLALPDNMLLPMDGFFSMHASLQPMHDLYKKKELLVLHASATPYRERSHFDAQDLLENGASKPHSLSTGWLGRTVAALGGATEGLAIGSMVPLVLQGAPRVQSWAPATLPEVDGDFLNRVMHMYGQDEMLKQALTQGMGAPDVGDMGKSGRGRREFVDLMRTAAAFMSKQDGPRIATIDLGGWDTHANQGTDTGGRFSQAAQVLGGGMASFREGMGDAWKNTAVLVITEFGRTVAGNGTGGSDHGTASAAFLAGGSVRGGRVIGDWPGLSEAKLFQGRDLYPQNDIRALMKGVLQDHMAVSESALEQSIFPQSQGVRATPQLFV